MPFHFKKGEAPAKGLRRLCRERIKKVQDGLRERDGAAVVHEVRKEIKKLRALFRLVRGKIEHKYYHKTVKALHEVAHCLAGARDARVRLRALEKLAGRSMRRRFPEILQALRKDCRRETSHFQKRNSVAVAERSLKKMGRRMRHLKIKADGWAAIEPGLRRNYRRGQETGRLARRRPLPECFHEWRKQVKDLWYYFRLLSPVSPMTMQTWTDELETLGELLGDDHDLCMLLEFVRLTCADQNQEVKVLKHLIERRQKKLRVDALKLGSQLYAESPAVICRRLGNYWNDWRGKISVKKLRFDDSKPRGRIKRQLADNGIHDATVGI